MTTQPATPAPRLDSLDQFRGYTVLGMFVVNFLGSYQATPAWLKHHHTYCSYADTIMPGFLFAVGFAYRLTFLRRRERVGSRAAHAHAFWRSLGLVLIGVIVYRLGPGVKSWAEMQGTPFRDALARGLKRDVFQALTHIGVTCLWVLPVIGAGARWRVGFAVVCGVVFQFLSEQFYHQWVNTPPVGIDGGPLAFLTWTIPLITGSLACDAFLTGTTLRTDAAVGRLLAWAVVLMLIGYGLSCLNRVTPPNAASTPAEYLNEPPFVPPSKPVNTWTMSQRSGSLSYLTFAAGFSLALFLVFCVLCDRFNLRSDAFTTLGQNALIAYILADMVSDTIKPFAPRDAPVWFVLIALTLHLLMCWGCLRFLENRRLYLRL